MPTESGFKVYQDITRPSPEIVEQFKSFVVANVSDSLGSLFTMHHSVKPVYNDMRHICGPAFTVRARPGDNLLSLKAIELAQPGDVIVIATDGDETRSVWGGFMSMMSARKGLGGMVTDGIIRDVVQTRDENFPVFARGITPVAPSKNSTGQLNTTVSCAGVVVQPGDLVLGDEDGVVVVPRGEIEAVIEQVQARIEREAAWEKLVDAGELIPMDAIDEFLEQHAAEMLGKKD